MKAYFIFTIAFFGAVLVIYTCIKYAYYEEPFTVHPIRIGVITDVPTACHKAFPILIDKLRSDPSLREVTVEWHYETFLSYLADIDNLHSGYMSLEYDKPNGSFDGRFVVMEPWDGPTEFDWRAVTPEILFKVADSHADFTDLSPYGCRGALP